MRIVFLFFILMLAGCKGKEETDDKEIPPDSGKIEIITAEKLQEIISRRNGKPLFINVWATWCVPCIEEFPDIVRVSGDYKNGVDFISISADFPSETDSKIIPFLEKFDVDFPVYVINEEDTEAIIKLLNVNWSGALPATFIYNKSGDQEEFLLGLQSYSEFNNSIKKVLKN